MLSLFVQILLRTATGLMQVYWVLAQWLVLGSSVPAQESRPTDCWPEVEDEC